MATEQREIEIAQGWWPQVRARIRALHDWEVSADADLRDRRMVEYFRHRPGMMVETDAIDWYPPQQHTALLGDFMHLFGPDSDASDAKVIEFYGRYGPLRERVRWEGEELPAWVLRLEPEARQQLSTEVQLHLCEPLWWLRERAQELRISYDLYLALKGNRLSFVRSLIGGVPEGKRLLQVQIIAGKVTKAVAEDDGKKVGSFSIEWLDADDDAEPPARLRPLTDDQCQWWGESLLALQLNTGEQRSRRRWSQLLPISITGKKYDPVGEPAPASVGLVRSRAARDLLGVMYLQLGDLVAKHALLRECEGCRRLFYPARIDQRFCDSRCGDAARQREYYAERKGDAAKPKRPKAVAKAKGRTRR